VQATQGPTAGNSYSPDTIRFEYVIPEITAAQNGYIYRCEVRYCDVIEWERTSYYYDATLYVDAPQLVEPDCYIAGQPARLEMTHGTTLNGVTFGYRWELSCNNGMNWETVQDGASAVYETAAVTDAMEGWQIRVVYSIYANDKKLSEGTTDPVTIDTIGRLPVITKQPESVVHRLKEELDDDFPPDPDKITIATDTYYSFSVEANGENLHYRWQRSKDNGRTFEDLPAEDEARTKGWYKVAAGTTWQYRCIVYNDFGSVISNVATTRTLYPPTTSNPQDLMVPEHTDAVFRVDITQGLPYGTDVIWQVSKDGKTMADMTAEDGTVNVYSEVVNGEIHWYTTLTVSNVSQDMSGYMYRCIVKNQPNDEDYNGLRRSRHATLTVTYSCAAGGHKFDEGTVTRQPTCTVDGIRVFTCSVCQHTETEYITSPGHDWKAATCQSVKTCQREGCGVSEGGFDYTNHTGEPVWSYDDGGHTSRWNCCNTPDQPYSPHVYTDDADTTCNVCGYVRTVTPETVPVSQITLNKAETSISVGNSETLTAMVTPENATNKALKWASSDEDVATVAPDGTVTAVKVGTVTITATAADGSGKSATCTVTVIGGTTPSQPGGSTGGSSGGSSSGGGGGSSSTTPTKPETATKPDGTKVETVTKPDGTKVETTTGKDGSVSKTETKPDGSSVTENKAADGSTGTVKTDKNGQTEAAAKVSGKAVEDAKKNGEAVKVPVEVEATRNSSTAPTVSIELPKGAGETKVEIPVSNVTPGTVAVLVHPDGTEEIVKNSVPTEDGIRLTVDGSATVKIIDNSKDFIDTRDHWAEDAIDFVSARGLVNGMTATIYAPNNSTTRAQLWTILARQVDADLTGGNTWYEKAQNWAKDKGVSDGANPDAAINRAQMVTMLWRAVGQPAAGGAANFTDVPTDSYYAQAVAWAVENGITAGVGGGRFDPTATCTRAQIAAFLARSMK